MAAKHAVGLARAATMVAKVKANPTKNPKLNAIKAKLAAWLDARAQLQAVANGEIAGDAEKAAKFLATPKKSEQELGVKMGEFLQSLDPSIPVPGDLNSRAAAVLNTDSPEELMAVGIWPIILAGGVVLWLIIGSSLSAWADKAKFEREMEYYEATGQKPPGPWYTNIGILAGIGVAGWFLWSKTKAFDSFKAKKKR